MGFYQDQIVPLLVNRSMQQGDLAAYRGRVVPAAEGRVLEIGMGSGLNLNRAIGTMIEGAGFQLDRIETGYMRGPKPMTFMYEGSARPR